METTRRNFLKILPLSGLVFAVNPVKVVESLCKQCLPISTPAVATSGNELLTPSLISKEALRLLEDNLVMNSLINKNYRSKYKYKPIGNIITIRKPNRFTLSQ